MVMTNFSLISQPWGDDAANVDWYCDRICSRIVIGTYSDYNNGNKPW